MQRTELSFHRGTTLTLVFVENCDHPVDVKVNFLIGEAKIFDETDIYGAELFSQLCLNQRLEWDRKFFSELKESFRLATLEHERETDEVFFEIVSCRTHESMLRCKVKKVLGKDRSHFLYEFLQKYNEQERLRKKTLQLQVEAQQHVYNKRIQQLEKTQLGLEEKRVGLLSKLSGLYREKVKKLMELKDERDDESVTHSHEDRREIDQRSIGFNEVSSMFMPSMDFRP